MYNVAIVTYGINTQQGKCMHQHALDNPALFHPPIGVRNLLWRDPSKKPMFKVKHTENGDFENTQISLLHDKNFYTAADDLVTTIMEGVFATVDQKVASHLLQPGDPPLRHRR